MSYLVIVNAPGYLPDQEPEVYPTFDDAFLGLCRALVTTREALASDDGWEAEDADARLQAATDAACDEIKHSPGKPFSVQLMGLCHELREFKA